MELKKRNNYPKCAGIYKFTCLNNGKIYIGESINLHGRIGDHRRSSEKEKGKCYFDNALIKYGWDSFNIEILEIFENFNKETDNDKLLDIESKYMEQFNSTDKNKGYNVCKYSMDSTGIPKPPRTETHRANMSLAKRGKSNGPHKKESIEKMSISKLGKKRPEFSEEWKQNIGKGHVGLVMSEEAKQKISLAHKGKPKSKESVEKMRQSLIGKKASDETKEKMSRSQRGKKLSEEHRQKLIQSNKERVITEETREKMRNSQKGKSNASGKRSEESKQRMREARLAYLEKQKNFKQ